MSKEPAKRPAAVDDEGTEPRERDEFAEFLRLARQLVAVPKDQIDAARAGNGTEPQPE